MNCRRDLIRLISEQAYMAWVMSMCNVPALNKYFNDIGNPRLGDLVMEISTHGIHPPEIRIGYLRRISKHKSIYRKVWTIETLYNRSQQNFENCKFIRILEKEPE